MSIVVGAFWTVSKGLEGGLEIREKIKTIQIKIVLKSTKVLRRFLET